MIKLTDTSGSVNLRIMLMVYHTQAAQLKRPTKLKILHHFFPTEYLSYEAFIYSQLYHIVSTR